MLYVCFSCCPPPVGLETLRQQAARNLTSKLGCVAINFAYSEARSRCHRKAKALKASTYLLTPSVAISTMALRPITACSTLSPKRADHANLAAMLVGMALCVMLSSELALMMLVSQVIRSCRVWGPSGWLPHTRKAEAQPRICAYYHSSIHP